jgi:hypothetical protein
VNIFGITPIDTALSAWGLSFSYILSEYLFLKSPIGVLIFLLAFIGSILETVKKVNIKHVLLCVFLSFVVFFLLILPKREPVEIKSAVELHTGNSSLTAQSLKDAQIDSFQMPLFLSLFAQLTDVVSINVVSLIDQTLNKDLKFFKGSFHLQKLSLEANHMINSSFTDQSLKEELDNFMYVDFLPAFIMHQTEQRDRVGLIWPGHEQILTLYTAEGAERWKILNQRFKKMIDSPHLIWKEVRETINQIKPIQENDFDEQLIASMIKGQYSLKNNDWITWMGRVQLFFPYIQGWANFCLYASFPFVIVILILSRDINVILYYLEAFIWIKSWTLGAATSFYCSLFAARIQSLTSTEISWFWNSPYYVVFASVLLVLMPFLALMAIHTVFKFIGNRI